MPDNIDNILSDTSIRKLKIVENMDFIPPEILKNKTINEKSALWSLGIFIYTLFFKEFPFKGNNEKEILEKISKKNIKQTNISKLDDLINNLLVEDPIKRLSWEQYFNHQFFTEKEDTKGDFRQNYIIKEKIGVTDFAKIFKVLDKQNNEIKCLKIYNIDIIKKYFERKILSVPKEENIKPYINLILKEINNMGIMGKNENSVKLYEYYKNEKEISLIMELCDDNLLNYFIKKQKPFNLNELKELLNQLNNSFRIINDNKMILGCLNLENIFVKYEDKRCIFKLKIKIYNKYYRKIILLNYIAPEILRNEKYDEKCDLWSLGVIIYILFFKEYPFSGHNEKEILAEIEKNKNNLKTTNDPNLDILIKGLLNVDKNKRLSWNDYFSSPFFKKYKKQKK